MFNFSANNLTLVKTIRYDRCDVHILKDNDTNRSYKVYDYKKVMGFEVGNIYKVSGKINSAKELYLIGESYKEQTKK